MDESIYQLGAVAIIFIFFLKEFFAYLKSKSESSKQDPLDRKQDIQIAKIEERLATIEKLTSNHIAHIQDDIKEIHLDIKFICNKMKVWRE